MSVLLLPTVSAMAPPWPPVAVPVPIEMLPELPDDVVPELNTIAPLMPLLPALSDLIVTDPLDVDDPNPEATATAPPVAPLPLPAVISMAPPEPVVPVCVVEPATMLRAPPMSLLPLPTVILT